MKLLDLARIACVCTSLVLAAGCAAPRWNGEIEQYGSVQEAMRGGAPANTGLSVARRDDRWGLGVLEGAAGELVVADGFVWLGLGESPERAVTQVGYRSRAKASWLALARVPAWREQAITRDMDLDALGAFAAQLAAEEGWDIEQPIPFWLLGSLTDVELHIVRGACPHAGEVPPENQPFQTTFATAHGTLVGLWAPNAGGELVHHGDKVHIHALLRDPTTMAAHLDRAVVRAGSVLRVPLGR